MENKKTNKNKKEIQSLHWLTAFLLALIMTGFVAWLNSDIPPLVEQAFSLIHVVAGFGLASIFIYYSYIHFKRTIGLRRPLSIVFGVFVFLTFILLIISGAILIYTGIHKRSLFLYDIHVYTAFTSVFFLVFHIIYHFISFPKRRLIITPTRFLTVSSSINKALLYGALGVFVGTFILLLLNPPASDSGRLTSLHANYAYDYGPNPFSPSLIKSSTGAFINSNEILNSEHCITCHKGIGEQWLASAHRHAADDPTYVRNINLLEELKGISATRYCEGCHAPSALLTGSLTPGGQHGGVKGTAMNNEGLSCMSCHGIHKLTGSQGVASYSFQPRTPYLFEEGSNWLYQKLHNQVLKLKPDLHKKELLSPVQKTSEYCGSCHTQFMDKSMNNWGWVKMQDDLLAWTTSKFNSPKDSRFSHPERKNCQECHMPLVAADDISANKQGKVKSHYFVGSNVMLAKHFGNDELLKKTKRFLQQDKISIIIEPPEDHEAKQNTLFVSNNLRSQQKYPVALYRNNPRKIKLLISNQGIGHDFPGGTIDLNEAWIDFKVFDGRQKLIMASGELQNDGSIDSNAVVYKEVPIDRFGNAVWRHDLFNMIGRSYINVIPAGSTDIVEYELNVPDWATSPITISATVKFRKLNQRYFDWVNEANDIKENPVIDIARDSILVPLLKSPSTISVP
jgi:hypothetical protein